MRCIPDAALCFVEWSISNSYTIASEQTSYVTLNLYASNNGTVEITAPYNLTIFNPAYVDAFSWNFDVSPSYLQTLYLIPYKNAEVAQDTHIVIL